MQGEFDAIESDYLACSGSFLEGCTQMIQQ
jgi:hypothetical protein